MNARASIQRIARDRALIDPEREVCRECRGSGRGDYGPCQSCDGFGSWPVETTRLQHVERRTAQNLDGIQMAALDRAIEKQPHAFSSGAASPRNAGEAAGLPLSPAASNLSKRKAA